MEIQLIGGKQFGEGDPLGDLKKPADTTSPLPFLPDVPVSTALPNGRASSCLEKDLDLFGSLGTERKVRKLH